MQQRDGRIGKKPSSDLRSEHLFKAVLKAQAGTPFLRASNLQLSANPSSAAAERRHARYESAISPMCDRCKSAFNFALNAGRFALPVDGSCTTKERDMKRLIACMIGVALLLAASVGLMIATAQQAQPPAFIAGDRPVTAEQVREKLQTDGWSNVAISRSGRYIEVTGSVNGETSKMAVDSQTGRLRADNDDDDDD
jgi:hypothetical protein